MYEKKAYALVKVLGQMEYVSSGLTPVPKLVDHGSLLYVLTAVTLRPNSPWYKLTRLRYWAMYVSRFGFIIEHIDYTGNVFADILTRYSKRYIWNNTVFSSVAAIYKSSILSPEHIRAPNKDELAVVQ